MESLRPIARAKVYRPSSPAKTPLRQTLHCKGCLSGSAQPHSSASASWEIFCERFLETGSASPCETSDTSARNHFRRFSRPCRESESGKAPCKLRPAPPDKQSSRQSAAENEIFRDRQIAWPERTGRYDKLAVLKSLRRTRLRVTMSRPGLCFPCSRTAATGSTRPNRAVPTRAWREDLLNPERPRCKSAPRDFLPENVC